MRRKQTAWHGFIILSKHSLNRFYVGYNILEGIVHIKFRLKKLNQNTKLKTAAIEFGLITYPFALKGLAKLAKSGVTLPPPIRLAVLAAPYGIKLAVYGYGLHKAAHVTKTTL